VEIGHFINSGYKRIQDNSDAGTRFKPFAGSQPLEVQLASRSADETLRLTWWD